MKKVNTEKDSESQKIKDALRKSEEKYRLLFNQIMSGFALHEVVLDAKGKPVDYRFLEVNNSFSVITGLKAQDIIGKTCLEVLPDTEPFWFETYGEVALTGKTIKFEQFNVSLNKYFEVIAYSDQKGQFVAMFNDITERKKNEDNLRKANIFLDSIIENIPNMIFLKDANELRFVRFNKAGEYFLGISREELLGKNDHDLFPKNQADFFTENDRRVLQSKQLLDIPEEPIQTKQQGIRILHTKKVPVFNELGEPEFMMGISEDITERKLVEETLAEKMKELERFHHLAVGRELAMIELKKEVNALLIKSGMEEKYKIVE